MKIGILFEKSPSAGGGFQTELSIVRALDASTHEFEFVVFSSSGNAGTLSAKFRVVKLNHSLFAKLASWFSDKCLRYFPMFYYRRAIKCDPFAKQVAKSGVDLMYFMSPSPLALRQSKPFIFTVWDLQHRLQPEFPEVSQGGAWELREALYKHATGKAFMVVADSETGKKHIENFYHVPAEKIEVIPFMSALGVNSKKFDIKKKHNLTKPYIFYPAQFWPHKNHLVLLEALKELNEKSVQVDLVCVGSDKGNFKHIKKLADSLGVGEQFRYLGFVADEDLAQLYREALALAMPTYFGPTNIPIYEAFAYGCPVISSDLEGIREQIGGAGIVANPGHSSAWAEAILKLYSDIDLRAKYIARGLDKAKEFDSVQLSAHLQKIFSDFSMKRRLWG